jgi:hypothetical protein
MQDSYILTAMFFADDYCTQVRAVDGHGFLSSNSTLLGPTPYPHPLSGKQDTLNPSPTNTALTCRHVTIDLGQEYIIDWLDWWPNQEEANRVPETWQVEVSLDGKNYFQVFAIDQLDYLWGTALLIATPFATRSDHVVSFIPVNARFVRLYFDNATRKNYLDEWAVELRLTPVENHSVIAPVNLLPNFKQQFTSATNHAWLTAEIS